MSYSWATLCAQLCAVCGYRRDAHQPGEFGRLWCRDSPDRMRAGALQDDHDPGDEDGSR